MKDPRIEKLAKLLVNYSLKLKKGDKFLVSGHYLTEPLMREVYKEAILVGAFPQYFVELDGISEQLYKHGTDEQLTYISPLENMIDESYDAYLSLWGGNTTKPMAGIPNEKISMRRMARKENFTKFLDRLAKGEARWCGTQYPTFSSAQDADMTLEDYSEFIFGAGLLDLEDPVAAWEEVSAKQEKICDFLNTKKDIHFVSEGTDLRLNVDGRKWINCDGRENFPDGEVFSTPIKDSVNGTIRFTYPAIYAGKEVENVMLTFKDGKVIEASASKGEDFLNSVLDTDEGARFVGEIAIGTNYGIKDFTKNTLFDEKIGGTIHLAVGAALPETGGHNESSVHWDMVCDMRKGGKIFADGELIYENGEFIVDFE